MITSISMSWRAQDQAALAAQVANENRIENCYQTELIRRILGDRAGPVSDHHEKICRGLDFGIPPERKGANR